VIRGAVIVLVDIDARRRSARLGRDIAEYARQFLAVIREPLLIVDEVRRVRWANDAYYECFHVVEQETVGQLLSDLDGARWAEPELARRIEGLLAGGAAFRDVPIRGPNGDEAERTVAVNGSRLPAIVGEGPLILLSFAPQATVPPAA
jgi:PAS domain-containing protein